MAPEAVAGFGGEGAEAEGPVGDVAVDGVAAGRGQAEAAGAAAARAEGAYLEVAEPAPLGLVDQRRFQPRQCRCGPHRSCRRARLAIRQNPAQLATKMENPALVVGGEELTSVGSDERAAKRRMKIRKWREGEAEAISVENEGEGKGTEMRHGVFIIPF